MLFFGSLSKKLILLKSLFFQKKIAIFKGSSLQKSIKNPAKNHANFVWENKIQKKAQEMDLGRFWPSFGKGLGRSGASFGRSWALLGHFGGVQNRAFVKH